MYISFSLFLSVSLNPANSHKPSQPNKPISTTTGKKTPATRTHLSIQQTHTLQSQPSKLHPHPHPLPPATTSHVTPQTRLPGFVTMTGMLISSLNLILTRTNLTFWKLLQKLSSFFSFLFLYLNDITFHLIVEHLHCTQNIT